MAVQLNLLGGFQASGADGVRLTFPTLKSQALLAFLVLNDGPAQSRDKLSNLLWGDSPDQQARASLRQALLRVRKTWPADSPYCLLAESNSVAVDPATVEVDVAAFERLAALGTPDALAQAAALYRGDLLDGFTIREEPFEDWLRDERARLQDLALGILQRLLDHYSQTGAIERGIPVAIQLLALDPYQESVHRTLMRFYLEQERRGAALGQYRRCCEILRDELAVDPEPETELIYQQIIKERPELEGTAGPVVQDPGYPQGASDKTAGPSIRLAPDDKIADRPSIAILPFACLSEDSEQRYLCDGVSEDIITELTRFRELTVIARNSAFSYRGSPASRDAIGRELGVQYLLEGSLRRQGGRIRVTVQLIEAGSGHQLWAERYDEALDDLLALQDEVVRRIVVTLVGRIADDRLAQAKRKPPESWQAYDHWLQGMTCLRQVGLDSLKRAREAFEQAIVADPAYARAHAGIAMTQFRTWSCFNWNPWAYLDSERAFDHARQAVELDESDHHAHCILGTAYLFRREFERAESHMDRAIAINPNDANTLANASMVWSLLGEAEKAVATGETAVRVDPFHPDWYLAMLGLAHFVARDYGPAMATMGRAPDALCDTRAILAAACGLAGEESDAQRHGLEFLRVCSDRMGGDPETDIERYLDWLIRTNAYRRPQDAEHFAEGLRLAGLPVPKS